MLVVSSKGDMGDRASVRAKGCGDGEDDGVKVKGVLVLKVVEDEDVGLVDVALDGAWGVVKEDDDLVEVMGVCVSSSSSKVRLMKIVSLVFGETCDV